ncbi:hypothetical protein ACR3K2_09730 [Cryptosporidium serpentis]
MSVGIPEINFKRLEDIRKSLDNNHIKSSCCSSLNHEAETRRCKSRLPKICNHYDSCINHHHHIKPDYNELYSELQAQRRMCSCQKLMSESCTTSSVNQSSCFDSINERYDKEYSSPCYNISKEFKTDHSSYPEHSLSYRPLSSDPYNSHHFEDHYYNNMMNCRNNREINERCCNDHLNRSIVNHSSYRHFTSLSPPKNYVYNDIDYCHLQDNSILNKSNNSINQSRSPRSVRPITPTINRNNRRIIMLALNWISLSGEHNKAVRRFVSDSMNSEQLINIPHFVILFHYDDHKGIRGIYTFNKYNKVWHCVIEISPYCPPVIEPYMIQNLYRFDTCHKTFKQLKLSKMITDIVDGVSLKPEYLNKKIQAYCNE